VRRRALLLGALLALVAAGCGSTKTVTKTVTVDASAKSGVRTIDQFGYIRSLKRKGTAYELRFDPALMLVGVTANTAAAEDGKVEPGEPVPNDSYTVDEGHRAFTYIVPAGAQVTVLTEGPDGTRVTVAQLAQLVRGKNPLGRPLFEPLRTGFWIKVRIDTVQSLDQQYRP
jgi:hypothetical protein